MTLVTLITGMAATVSCVLCVQVGGTSVIDAFVTPEYAKKDVVYEAHRDVYNKIEAIVRLSATIQVAERRVQDARWPDKVIHVALANESDCGNLSALEGVVGGSKEGYSRSMWENLRAVIRNGAGYGTVITENGQLDIVAANWTSPATRLTPPRRPERSRTRRVRSTSGSPRTRRATRSRTAVQHSSPTDRRSGTPRPTVTPG